MGAHSQEEWRALWIVEMAIDHPERLFVKEGGGVISLLMMMRRRGWMVMSTIMMRLMRMMTNINLSASLLRRAVAWVLFSHSGSQFLHQSSRPDLRSGHRPSLTYFISELYFSDDWMVAQRFQY